MPCQAMCRSAGTPLGAPETLYSSALQQGPRGPQTNVNQEPLLWNFQKPSLSHYPTMSTITSPRASVASLQTPTCSRRTSIDTVTRSQASSPSRVPPPQQRRNRAALRDYYGIKSAAAPVDTSSGLLHEESVEATDSELDREGFDAEAYVAGVLGRERLEGILKVEGGLINGSFWTLRAGSKGTWHPDYKKCSS